MQKKSIIAILSAVVLMVVASLALVFTIGSKTSADSEVIETVPVEYLNIDSNGVLGDGNTSGGAFTADGKTWIKNNAKYRVEIPAGVTSIGRVAFEGCSGLTSITIPETVTSIGVAAFSGCSGLTSITIPEGVTGIRDSAFRDCSGLTSIMIPDSVTSIGRYAFSGCSGLTSITVDPSNTKYTSQDNEGHECNCIIEKSSNKLLYGCQSTIIPTGVTSIGGYAFYDCSGLTSIMIPSSVTNIDRDAFLCCSGLISMTVDPKNYSFTSRDDDGRECNCIMDKYQKLLFGCQNTRIPYGVNTISQCAFYGRSGLTSITIPYSVTKIEDFAFEKCSGLTSIKIPSSVKSIGWGAFEDCSGLTSIEIPSSVTRVSSVTFLNCSSLSTVKIPSSVTSIERSAFAGCISLISIEIPESVTNIGGGVGVNKDAVFDNCSNLKEIIVRNPDLKNNELLTQGNKSKIYYGADQNAVTFVTNCNTTIDKRLVNFGKVTTEPTTLTKNHYTFIGWYKDARYTQPFTFDTPIKYDITLYAKWQIIPTVTFMVDDAEYGSETVEYNTAVSVPTEPTKTGYTFMGWYRNNAAYDFNTLVTENITLTAKWNINQYTVEFWWQNGTHTGSQTVNYGTPVQRPTDPTKEGYTFVGWFTDDLYQHPYDFNTPVTEDFGLFAQWTINQYTVTFDSKQGSSVLPQTVNWNTKISRPSAPVREGYDFLGWYLNNEEYNFDEFVTDNMTLTAKWKSNNPDDPAESTEENPTVNNQNNNALIWGIAGTAAGILIIAGIVVGIIISKRRRK